MIEIFTLLLSAPFAQVPGGGIDHETWVEKRKLNGRFADSLALAPDMNGDGVEDFIVGAPGMGSGGRAFAYSGTDLQQLFVYTPPATSLYAGESVCAIGDTTGDGVSEVAVADFEKRSVYIFDGTGAHKTTIQINSSSSTDKFQPGFVLHSPGDLTGDGIPDLAIGAPYANINGQVHFYTGQSFGLMYSWSGTESNGRFGCSLDSVEDQDGDGISEFLVGASGEDGAHTSGLNGRVHLLAGGSGAAISIFTGTGSLDRLGSDVKNAGDLNGDGREEILASAPGVGTTGEVHIYSGSNGAPLRTYYGEVHGEQMGTRVANGGDLNADGIPDQIATSPWYGYAGGNSDGHGRFRAFCGKTGELIYDQIGTNSESLGSSAISLPDGPNQLSRLIFGARTRFNQTEGHRTGAFYVANWQPFLNASVTEVSISNGTLLTYELDFPTRAGGHEFKLLVSFSGTNGFHYGVDIPLSYDAAVQSIYDGSHSLAPHLSGTLNQNGYSLITLYSNPGSYAYLVGRSLNLAAIAQPAGGLPQFSSIAVPLTVNP